MLGKAPTRIAVCASESTVPTNRNRQTRIRTTDPLFLMSLPSQVALYNHGQHSGVCRLFLPRFLCGSCLAVHKIGQCGVIEDAGGCVTDIEKHPIESTVLGIAINQSTQLLGVAEW